MLAHNTTTIVPTTFPLFAEGMGYILTRWTALQLAIDFANHNPSANKQQELHGLLSDFFMGHGASVERDELADNLALYMDEEFSLMLEDSSEEQVAEAIVKLYRDIVQKGDTSELERLRQSVANKTAAATRAASQRINQDNDGDSSDDDYNDGEDGDCQMGAPSSSTTSPPHFRRSNITDSEMMMDGDESYAARNAPEPVIDQDGFELVQKKGRRR